MQLARITLPVIVVAFIAGGLFWKFSHVQPEVQSASVSASIPSSSASDLVVGTWISADDTAYSVTFNRDMTMSEQYGTSTVSSGRYSFAATPDGYVATDTVITPGHPTEYLLEDIDEEKYAYRVRVVNTESLELEYVERGNSLSFIRK